MQLEGRHETEEKLEGGSGKVSHETREALSGYSRSRDELFSPVRRYYPSRWVRSSPVSVRVAKAINIVAGAIIFTSVSSANDKLPYIFPTLLFPTNFSDSPRSLKLSETKYTSFFIRGKKTLAHPLCATFRFGDVFYPIPSRRGYVVPFSFLIRNGKKAKNHVTRECKAPVVT